MMLASWLTNSDSPSKLLDPTVAQSSSIDREFAVQLRAAVFDDAHAGAHQSRIEGLRRGVLHGELSDADQQRYLDAALRR